MTLRGVWMQRWAWPTRMDRSAARSSCLRRKSWRPWRLTAAKVWWYRVGEEASTSATAHYEKALREHAREMQIRIRIFTVVTWGAGVLGSLLLLHTAALFFQRLHEGATPWRTGLMLAVQGSVGALAAYLSESFLWPKRLDPDLAGVHVRCAEVWAWVLHAWRTREAHAEGCAPLARLTHWRPQIAALTLACSSRPCRSE